MAELMLMMTVLAVLPAVWGCPLSCQCDFFSKRATCHQVTSLAEIAKNMPPGTQTLTIDQGSFTNIQQADLSYLPTKQITTLTITRGSLDEIFDNAFAEIAISLQTLNLKENRIRAIATGAFVGLKNLKALDLSRNRLSYFPQDIFKPLMNLNVLNLGYNQYTNNFPSNVFTTQKSLHTLTLDGNKLGSLQPNMFVGLQQLQSLHVGNCMINNIDNDLFLYFKSLANLDLSYNQLYSLPAAESFNNLRSLRNLTLLGNRLTVVNQDQFKGLQIDTLDLTRNQISQLHPNAFRGMGSVRYLHLTENNLVNLPESVFNPIGAQLYSLQLNANRGLSLLPSAVFSGLQQIRELNLSYCGLQQLDDDHFKNLFTLQKVDLSYNRLEYLPNLLLQRANTMTQLKIGNNPWNCDCLIKPFRAWLQNPRSPTTMGCNVNVMSPYDTCKPICSTPTTLMYQDISMLSDNVLNDSCGKLGASQGSVQVEVIVGIIGAIVLIIVIIIVAACCLYRKHKQGPGLCTSTEYFEPKPRKKVKERHKNQYFEEKKEKRKLDAETSSMNESDKSFVVRNFFHSMAPDPEGEESQGTQSMTRKGSEGSIESLSQYDYGSRHGSRHSSQYSLNMPYRIESAV